MPSKDLTKVKEQNHRYYVKAAFDITVEEYQNLRETQRAAGDLCGLCKQPLGLDANLDHDHETGKLREFLHSACNKALGLLKEDPKVCRLAAEYLEKHKESNNAVPVEESTEVHVC